MTRVCSCVLTVQRGAGPHTGPAGVSAGKARDWVRAGDAHLTRAAQEASTRLGVRSTHWTERACVPLTAPTFAHTRVLDCTHTRPCSCVHTCPHVSGHGLPIVTTSPAAPQKGLSAAIPLVGSQAASGLALFFPHEVSFPPPASGPLLPREFPLSCSRWQSAAGCQEKQGPARSALLRSPPHCGSAPLPVGCDQLPCGPSFASDPPLHFGGLAL